MKKSLLTIGALGTIVAPLTAAAACGESLPENGTITFTDAKTRSAVASTLTVTKSWTSVLALDGTDHSVTDKSFNQSAYEGMAVSSLNTNVIQRDVTTPSSTPATDDTAGFVGMYNAITGNKVIVAPGFLHMAPLMDAKGKEATKNQAVIFIDGDIAAGNVASIVFQAHQSGFLAGVQAGYYLNENVATFGPELKVGTFGGMNIPSVVSYMGGFQKGIEYFNAHKPTVHNVEIKDIEFIDLGNKAQYFTGGFAPGMAKDVSNKLLNAGADLIFPVAGPQTADVETAIKAKNGSKTKIIGVDVAQENIAAFPHVVFSALKDIKGATDKMLQLLSGVAVAAFDGGLGKLSIGTLDNNLVGVSKGAVSDDANAFATSAAVKTAAKAMKLEFKF